MSVSMLYVTAESREQALSVGRTLVTERLIACANVIDGMTSVYRWKDQLEQSDEVVLLLKTRTELVERAIARVRELHPYDVPCIVSWPLGAGNSDYLDWIDSETGVPDEPMTDSPVV